MNPNPKTISATLAAAVVTIVVYLASLFGATVPAEVQGALTTILVAVAAYVTPQGDWQPKADS